MPGGQGYRCGTRYKFARAFRSKGYIPLSVYLRTYKVGDYVDIKVNGAVHKGMPHKFYHGRSGRVWNVTRRAIGVEINKQVNGRVIAKRLHVRIEHVQPSRCREDLLLRDKAVKEAIKEAKARGETIPKGSFKRQPKGPRTEGFVIANAQLSTITPIPYDILKESVL